MIFVGSLTYSALNYEMSFSTIMTQGGILNSVLFPHIIVWCACFAYFFGFFGISFIDKPGEDEEDEEEETKGEEEDEYGQHTPINDTPTCADKSSHVDLNAKKKSGNLPMPEVAPQPLQQPPPQEGTGPNFEEMEDEEVLEQLLSGSIKDYQLEKKLGDYERAVKIRRMFFQTRMGGEEVKGFEMIPHQDFDYQSIFGANCEIVIGYVPIPLGLVGPLLLDGSHHYVPMATTEGS